MIALVQVAGVLGWRFVVYGGYVYLQRRLARHGLDRRPLAVAVAMLGIVPGAVMLVRFLLGWATA